MKVLQLLLTPLFSFQIKPKPGANSCPFQLVSYWKCGNSHTDLKIDYKYNSHAMSSPSPLLNVSVAVPVDGGVRNMHSKPTAQWYVTYHARQMNCKLAIDFYLTIGCRTRIASCGSLRSCPSTRRTTALGRCWPGSIWKTGQALPRRFRRRSTARERRCRA